MQIGLSPIHEPGQGRREASSRLERPEIDAASRSSSLDSGEPSSSVQLGPPPDLWGFARRLAVDADLYGELAFAETAESLRLCSEALAVGPGDRVVGITSSADVLLTAVASEAEAVIGFDVNPMQTALAHLKLAAIRALDLREYLGLLGITAATDELRLRTFDRVSRGMPGPSRAHLLGRRRLIRGGILNQGMTYLIIRALLATLRRLVDRETMALFIGQRGSDAERSARFSALMGRASTRVLIEPSLRLLAPHLKWLFFPRSLCRVSTRPDEMIAGFFDTFAPLFTHGAVANPVLCRAATGRVHPEWTSLLYDERRLDRIRSARTRIEFESGDLSLAMFRLPSRFATRVYLSNLPDYLSEEQLDALATHIERVAAPGARILYFSLCDDDRFEGRIGPRIEGKELDRIRSLDTVHLYRSIVVRIARGRE